jgi:hypothetical protein
MFVKLIALLISNVYISFSVLLCCMSLALKCGLKGRIGQNEDPVPASALERTSAIECIALEPSRQDRERLHRARRASVQAHLCLSARPTIEHTPHQPAIPVLP